MRIPEEVEKEILEIIKQEKSDKAIVVRNLLEIGLSERRKQTALEFLRKGKVTFSKAAELAKVSLWEFADLVKQRNVEWVRYTPKDVEKEFSEASAAKSKIDREHPGMIYVHQQKLSVGECIKRLKAITETKSPKEMRNQIIFL